MNTVPCKFCARPTAMTATEMCDSCYEVASRVRSIQPQILALIVKSQCDEATVDELIASLHPE